MAETELDHMRQMIEEAREQFSAQTTAVLDKAKTDADVLALAIGEVSADQAYSAWCRTLLTALMKTVKPEVFWTG